MQIENCSIEDFNWVFQNLEQFWGDRRTEHIHHPMFAREFGDTAFVIKENNSIIGYLFAFLSPTENCGYIHATGVHKNHQRKGIGKILYANFTEFCVAHGCNSLKAITSPQNKDSIAFHEALGFQLIGSDQVDGIPVIKDYSGPGKDRVVMIKAASKTSNGKKEAPLVRYMNIAEKINSVSKLKGEFKLRSGQISDTYFDKYQFEADPAILKEVAMGLKNLVPANCEVLAGLEMGGIPVVTMLSQVTGIPAAFIRKEPKGYGTCRYAEGKDLRNKKIVIIEDVVSSGGAIIDAASLMRNDGIEIDIALCVIDRETGGKEKLRESGIELISLLTKSEIEGSHSEVERSKP